LLTTKAINNTETTKTSLVPRPHPLARKTKLVNCVKFIGLACTSVTYNSLSRKAKFLDFIHQTISCCKWAEHKTNSFTGCIHEGPVSPAYHSFTPIATQTKPSVQTGMLDKSI